MAGVIDEAAVFDTALSLKEIQTIFKSPNGLVYVGQFLPLPHRNLEASRHLGHLKGQ